MLQNVMRRFRSFTRNRKGNVAILFGLAIVPIVLAVGVAMDYGQALIVRGRMADAVDSAALAVGSWQGLTEAEIKDKAQKFFDANYPPSALGAVGKINVNLNGDDIKIDVSGSVPTSFLKLANISKVDVGASTVVTKRQRNIELALVLDTTGSMSSGGKMSAMQSAAKKMVQALFDGNATSDTLKVAVVPFAAAVNVGDDKKNESWIDANAKSAVSTEDFKAGVKVFDLYNQLDNVKSKWKWAGCVREREGTGYELTDAAPSSSVSASLFAPYLAPDEPDSDHADDKSYKNSYISDDDCGENKKKNRTPATCQRYTGKYSGASTSGEYGSGPDLNCPPRPVTPLTNTQTQVNSAIDQLEPKGNTVIPAGLLWGWRVLSPSAPFTEGKPYDDEKWIKAIVLLTDGENYVNGGKNTHNKSSYNAFGYPTEGHLGAANGSKAEEELNLKMQTVCNAIKAKTILIYTIGFQVTDSTTQNLLKNCATKPDMYFNSPSNAQLAGIFKDIAQGLSELRIAQ